MLSNLMIFSLCFNRDVYPDQQLYTVQDEQRSITPQDTFRPFFTMLPTVSGVTVFSLSKNHSEKIFPVTVNSQVPNP